MFAAPAICTYFDHRYLARAIVLYESVKRHMPAAHFYVLALSDECVQFLEQLQLPDLQIIPLGELESARPELAEIKAERSIVEYYFTLSPALPLYLLEELQIDAPLFYLDADACVYQSFEQIAELSNASTGITPHRFPDEEREREAAGKFNVGFQYYSGDAECRKLLAWWRDRCYEWCFDQMDVENDRYADQKYLDRWTELFQNVRAIQHPGVNCAPWNLSRYRLSGGPTAPVLESNESHDLVFFHFQGLRRIGARLTRTGLEHYRIFQDRPRMRAAHRLIYAPYLRALRAAEARVSVLARQLAADRNASDAIAQAQALRYVPEAQSLLRKLKDLLKMRLLWSWR